MARVELDTARRRIDFDLTCNATRLPCPHCALADQGVHDRLSREWRHLDFFQFEACGVEAVADKAAYTRQAGFAPIQNEQMVLS